MNINRQITARQTERKELNVRALGYCKLSRETKNIHCC